MTNNLRYVFLELGRFFCHIQDMTERPEGFEEIEFEPKDFECEYSTMGGWAIEMLNAEPHLGDNFRYSDYDEDEVDDDDYEGHTELYVIVSGMDDMRITKLTVLVRNVEPEEEKEE